MKFELVMNRLSLPTRERMDKILAIVHGKYVSFAPGLFYGSIMTSMTSHHHHDVTMVF